MFWFWCFCGPVLALALWSLRGERKKAAYVTGKLSGSQPASLPPATIIVPVKGPEDGLRGNLAALAAQEYPDFELIVTARRAEDIPAGVLPPRVRVVLAHGEAPGTGEKIQNLLAAVRAARKHSDVLAFADADGRPGPGWLRSLAAPLADETVGAATGYRWYTPQPPAFWSLMRSVWNAVIAGTLGAEPCRFAWGGSMAMRKETFFVARVPDFWKNAVSDDYRLSAAVQAAGLRIVFAPGAMVAADGPVTAREFFGWARRQLLLARFHDPRQWWLALAAHFLYCGAMSAAVAASVLGNRGAEWVLIALLTPGMLKGVNRAALARAELPAYEQWFRRFGWVHAWWVPLATWVWLATLAASAFGRTLRWRGNRYVLGHGGAVKSGYNDGHREGRRQA